MSQHAPNPLFGISGLRALACLSVVFYHLNQQRSIENLAKWNWDIYQFTETMTVVVSFFFILTAAGISLKFWPSILQKTPGPSAWRLFQERTLRIAPAYWAVLLVTFTIVWGLRGTSGEDWVKLVSGITFLSWIQPNTFFPVDMNGPLWYISFDMMGAILTFATMSILSKVHRKLIPVFLAWIGALLVLGHFSFVQIPFAETSGIMSEWFPNRNPLIFGLHFLVGIVVGYFLTHDLSSRRKWTYDLLWFSIVAVLGTFLWEIRDMDDYAYSMWHTPFRFPLATFLIAGIIGTLPLTRYVSHFFEKSLFQFVARISYSVYLWHALVLVLLGKYFFPEMGHLAPGDWAKIAILTYAITGVIAWVSHMLLEVRLPKWLIEKRFGKSSR